MVPEFLLCDEWSYGGQNAWTPEQCGFAHSAATGDVPPGGRHWEDQYYM